MAGRTLDHAELFRLFCREAVRDGPRTPEDDELLENLQGLLRLEPDRAARMLERAPPAGPGEALPLNRMRAFEAACRLAWEDGELEKPERNLLMGLAQFLGISKDEAQERLTAAVHPPSDPGARTAAVEASVPAGQPEILGMEDETALVQAARGLDLGAVQEGLTAGASAAERGQHEWTPLHWTCRNAGQNPRAAVAVARALLEADAPVDAPERRGRRPLHLAARSGEVELVQVLLDAGTDQAAREWERSWTALHLAARGDAGDVIRALVEAGVPVDVRDAAGATPLHRAAENGAGEAVRVLLDLEASASATDMQGATPLRYARGGEHFEAAVHLEAREAPDLTGPDGLRAGSEAGDPVALFMMSKASGDAEAGLRYLERSWEARYPEAGVVLARFRLRGEAGPPDPEGAKELLEAAAATGHASALLELARLARDGEPERVTELLRSAAKQGSPGAMRRLAAALGPQDPEAGLWLTWAAALGDEAAQNELDGAMPA